MSINETFSPRSELPISQDKEFKKITSESNKKLAELLIEIREEEKKDKTQEEKKIPNEEEREITPDKEEEREITPDERLLAKFFGVEDQFVKALQIKTQRENTTEKNTKKEDIAFIPEPHSYAGIA